MYNAITESQLDDLAQYMDDDIRERIHSELAPCEPSAFWARYVELVGEDTAEEIASLAGVRLGAGAE